MTLEVVAGASVRAGQVVALVESMKLHHEVVAPAAGTVVAIAVAVGDTVRPGDLLVRSRSVTTAPTPSGSR